MSRAGFMLAGRNRSAVTETRESETCFGASRPTSEQPPPRPAGEERDSRPAGSSLPTASVLTTADAPVLATALTCSECAADSAGVTRRAARLRNRHSTMLAHLTLHLPSLIKLLDTRIGDPHWADGRRSYSKAPNLCPKAFMEVTVAGRSTAMTFVSYRCRCRRHGSGLSACGLSSATPDDGRRSRRHERDGRAGGGANRPAAIRSAHPHDAPRLDRHGCA